MKSITSFVFIRPLKHPVKFIQSKLEKDKIVTRKGYFTIKTMRQHNDLAIVKDDLNWDQTIKLHEEEYGTP